MFSIGEFARLGGVSVRTLRHYDEIRLLRPATGRGVVVLTGQAPARRTSFPWSTGWSNDPTSWNSRTGSRRPVPA